MSRTLFAIGSLAWCCIPATAGAGEFSWDLFGAELQSELGDLQDTDGQALAATYYFDPVDDSRGPYSLATFLDPVSRVSASVSHTRRTFHPINLGIVLPPGAVLQDSTVTTDDYTIGGRYVLSGSKWYAGGDYTKSKDDSVFDNDSKAYRVLAGRYLGPKTSLELALNRSEYDTDFAKSMAEDVGLSFVHVQSLPSLTYSLFGGVVQTNAHVTFAPQLFAGSGFPRDWAYSFGGEVFPTTKLGVRVGYTRFDGGANDDSYDVAATWFFKRNVGIQISWSRVRNDSMFINPNLATPTNDTADIRFIGRF